MEVFDIGSMERGRIIMLTRLIDAGALRIFDYWMSRFIASLQMSRSDEIITALSKINARFAQKKELEKEFGRGSALNLDHPFVHAMIHAYMQRGSLAISGQEISNAVYYRDVRLRAY